MPLTWTPEMGNVSLNSALEAATRAAIIAACTFVEGLDGEDEVPRFNGTTFVNPVNEAATELEAFCMAGVGVDVVGVDRQTILATAVAAAEFFATAGGSEDGWTALGIEIPLSRTRITGLPAPEPEIIE